MGLAMGGVLGPRLFAHMHISVCEWGHPRATRGHCQGGHLPASRAGRHPTLGSRLPALLTRARPLSRGPCHFLACAESCLWGENSHRLHCIQAGLDPGALRA